MALLQRLSRLAARAEPGELSHVLALESLAEAQLAAGHPAGAEATLREALAVRDAFLRGEPSARKPGTDDHIRAGVVRRLGELLEAQKRWDDLEALLLDAVAVDEAAGGRLTSSFRSLQDFYGDRRLWAQQEEVLRRIVALETGYDFRYLTLRQLAICLLEQGRLVEAEVQAQLAFNALAPVAELTSLNLAAALELLGRIRLGTGREDRAAADLAHAMKIYEGRDAARSEEEGGLDWFSRVALARVRRLAGDIEGAEDALREAELTLPAQEKVSTGSRARIAASWAALRRLQGRLDEADEWSDRAVALCATLDSEPEVNRCLRHVGPNWI